MDRAGVERVDVAPAEAALLDVRRRVFQTQHQDLLQLGPRRTCKRGARFQDVLR